MSIRKAIVVPVNPNITYYGGTFIGRILPHIAHIKKTGGVIWNCGRAFPHYKDIKKGYFYETDKKAITYEFDIIKIYDWSNKDVLEFFLYQLNQEKASEIEEVKYVPIFRKDDLDAIQYEFEMGKRKNAIGIVIKEINILKEPISPQRLIKVSDNKPIKTNAAVRSHPIVYYNSKFKTLKRDLDPKIMIHNYIKKIIEAQQYTERDIENILEYGLYNSDYEFVERQTSLKDGRIDILYKTKDSYNVIELKKGMADIFTLDQISIYIEDVKKEYNVDNVKGIIICETATEQLKSAINELPEISLNQFTFEINFSLNI